MIGRTLLLAILAHHVPNALAQSPVRVQLETFATGLTRITDIAHAGDERLFAVLQPGTIRIVMPDGTVLPTPFLNITARVNSAASEQGLLGLAFDPDYATNGFFYVNYTTGSGNGTTRVSRFSVTGDPDVADPGSEVVLFSLAQPYNNHNAGDLDFGPDGYLYIPLGDGGSGNDPPNNGQNLRTALGSILRIDVHGGTPYAIPPDNPFTNHGDTLPETWASGLRNPWRFGFDALTGDVWIGDVGQNAWEEVDFWPAGDNSGPNFGWRCREGLVATPGVSQANCQPASSYAPPVQVHVNGAGNWCSVIGGRVYRGDVFHRLYGRYIYTDYCLGRMFSLHPNGSGGWVNEQLTASGPGGITVIAENSALELFAGNGQNGILYRIVDACGPDRPTFTQTGNTLTSSPGQGYAWYLGGTAIPGADQQVYEAAVSGWYRVLVTLGPGCDIFSDSIFVSLVGLPERAGSAITVHPVPAGDRLVVDGLPAKSLSIELMDLHGRTVLTHDVRGQGTKAVLGTGHLATGNYVLVVRGHTGANLLQRVVAIEH